MIRNNLSVRNELVERIVESLPRHTDLGTNSSKIRTSKDVLLLISRGHAEGKPVTVSDVHLMLSISRSTAGRAIRTLEQAGVITRRNDRLDRRRQILALTGRAERVVNRLLAEFSDNPQVEKLPVEYVTGTNSPLNLYQHVSQLAGIGHMIWDPEADSCLFASPQAAELFNLDVEGFLRHGGSTADFISLVHPVARAKVRQFVKSFRRGGGTKELTYNLGNTADDRRTYLKHSLDRLPAPDGDKMLELHVFHDVTDRVSRVISLDDARIGAERDSRLSGDFIAHFSHELRTPLNAIIGFSQMLMGEVFGAHTHEKYREYADDIYHSGLQLLDIVNDVLDLSKLEAGKMKIEAAPMDVDLVINGCMRMIMRDAQANQVAISADVRRELPHLIADELRVRQILINLLSNAVKFTGPDGTIDIVADCDSDGAIMIEVRDNGVGIPAEELDRVTEPFQQASTANGDEAPPTGTGLGLTLVKFLAELHDAEFSLESAINQGTVATLKFPPERTAN